MNIRAYLLGKLDVMTPEQRLRYMKFNLYNWQISAIVWCGIGGYLYGFLVKAIYNSILSEKLKFFCFLVVVGLFVYTFFAWIIRGDLRKIKAIKEEMRQIRIQQKEVSHAKANNVLHYCVDAKN